MSGTDEAERRASTGCSTTWSSGCRPREQAVVLSADGLLMGASPG